MSGADQHAGRGSGGFPVRASSADHPTPPVRVALAPVLSDSAALPPPPERSAEMFGDDTRIAERVRIHAGAPAYPDRQDYGAGESPVY